MSSHAKIKDRLKNDDKFARKIYAAITIVSCALSVLLLVYIVFSSRNSLSDTLGVVPTPAATITNPSIQQGTINSGDSEAEDNTSERGESLNIEITDQDATTIATIAVSEKLEIEDLSVSFLSPDIFEINGNVLKESASLYVNSNSNIIIKGALMIAPEKIAANMKFTVSFDSKTQKFTATPYDVRVFNLDVTKFLPSTIVDAANDALNAAIPHNVKISSVEIDDGTLTLSFVI